MLNEHPKPRWWRLYAVLPLALVLLVLESQLAMPSWGHKVAQIGIVLFIMGLMGLWLSLNAYALTLEETNVEWLHSAREAQLRKQITATLQELQAEHLDSDSARFDAMRLPSCSEFEAREGRNN